MYPGLLFNPGMYGSGLDEEDQLKLPQVSLPRRAPTTPIAGQLSIDPAGPVAGPTPGIVLPDTGLPGAGGARVPDWRPPAPDGMAATGEPGMWRSASQLPGGDPGAYDPGDPELKALQTVAPTPEGLAGAGVKKVPFTPGTGVGLPGGGRGRGGMPFAGFGAGRPTSVSSGRTSISKTYGPQQMVDEKGRPVYPRRLAETYREESKARKKLAEEAEVEAAYQAYDMATTQEDILEYREQERAKVAALEQKSAQYFQQYEDARKAATLEQPNPDRWWSNRSKGQQIAMLMAAAIMDKGTFRHSMGMIQQAIDRDLKVQMAGFEKKRGERGELLNMVGMIDKRIGNKRAAAKLQEANMWSDVLRRGQIAAQVLRSPQIELQLQQDLGNIARKVLAAKKEAVAMSGPLRTTITKTRGTRTVSGAGAGGQAGLAGRKLTPKQSQDLAQARTTFSNWMDFYDRVYQNKKTESRWMPWPAKTVWDVPTWIESKAVAKTSTLYKELMSHAMRATRDLSGAQAARIETEAQRALQPGPLTSLDALADMRRRSAIQTLRSLVNRFKFDRGSGFNVRPHLGAVMGVYQEIVQRAKRDGDRELMLKARATIEQLRAP